MRRVLVTGATGHIGSNIVRDLRAHDYDPLPLARVTSDLTGLAGLGLDPVIGDLLDADSVRAAVDGCDAVIHAGAVYAVWARDPDEILRPAVEGTENVLRAAKDAGIERVVCTSSVASVGYTDDPDQPLDESHWNDGARNAYIRAKTLAERRSLELADELGVEVINVCPGGVFGALDYRITPTTQIMIDTVQRKMAVFSSSCPIDVRDVARGHVLALERGTPGERYILAGEPLSEQGMAELLNELAGVTVKRGLPPRWVLSMMAPLVEVISSMTGKPPMISRDVIHDLIGRHFVYDTTRAREELGLEIDPPRDVIRETLRWIAFLGAVDDPLLSELQATFPPDPSWIPQRSGNDSSNSQRS
jgi:dihydroflavonol-4-reductase